MAAPSSYVDLDYTSLAARLLALAKSAFPDVNWDDAASLERLLLELNAYVGDVVSYLINNTARESRWGTAQQRRSLLMLVKLIGYKPPGAVPAQYQETFTLAGASAAPVVLPAGTTVQTSQLTSPVVCQILAPLTIPAGQTTATALVEHSESETDTFASTGLANQTFILTQTPYLDGSAVIVAADGTYTEVPNFLESESADRNFTTSVDDLDRCTIAFGDGVLGSIPSGTITVQYKTGGGAAGNVIAGQLNRIAGNWTDISGNPVTLSVTNAAGPTQIGVDRTSAAQIQQLAPATLRTLGRAVAREDFEIAALAVPGVARAVHLTSNEDAAVPENSGITFVVPTAGGVAPPSLCTAVLAQCKQQTGYPAPDYPCLNTYQLSAQTAAYLVVNASMQLYFRKGYDPAATASAVRQALADYFAVTITPARLWQLAPAVASRLDWSQTDATSVLNNPLVDFGYNLQDVDGDPIGSFGWSDVCDLVASTPGVLRVVPTTFLLNGSLRDVPLATYQFPTIGSVSIVDATTGATL